MRWPATSLSQIGAITAMNLRNIAERITSSIVALVGIAGVVTVLIGVLSIAEGFRAVLDQSGSADVAIVLRSGATDEMGSSPVAASRRASSRTPQTSARDADGAIASPELYVIVDVPLKRTGTAANVPLRGVGPQAPKLRRNFQHRRRSRLHARHVRSDGRPRREPAVRRARPSATSCAGARPTGRSSASSRIAAASPESEIWTDATVLQGVYNRGSSYQSMRVRLTSAGACQSFKDTLTTDPRLNVKVFTEKQYYEEQSQTLTDAGAHDRHHDRRADGTGRDVRRAQHDVLRGLGAHARDRDAARARLRLRARRRLGAGRGAADRHGRRRRSAC